MKAVSAQRCPESKLTAKQDLTKNPVDSLSIFDTVHCHIAVSAFPPAFGKSKGPVGKVLVTRILVARKQSSRLMNPPQKKCKDGRA
jgi:hypothetical protein